MKVNEKFKIFMNLFTMVTIILFTAGIGFWTALDLARRNARVILACRDISKGQEAVEKIQAETANNNVVVRKLDVSLMKSVREFAEKFIAEELRLDILVNNAGMAGRFGRIYLV